MALLNPYLSFERNAREAMEFYQSVFDGALDISEFGSYPGMVQDPADATLVMHAQLTTPDGFTLMASDSPAGMPYTPPAGISVSLSGGDADADTLAGYWEALSEGGTVTMPFEEAPWGGRFGMLTDRYGVAWMINAGGDEQGAGGDEQGAAGDAA